MNGILVEGIITLGLLLLVLLGGMVLYLANSQKKFQRIDHTRVLDDDLREKQFNSRLKYLEQLIADMAKLEAEKRSELDRVIVDARQDLRGQVDEARGEIINQVLLQPGDVDAALLKHSGIKQGGFSTQAPKPEPRLVGHTAGSMVNFLRSPRQREIAELLEQGYSHQDTSRMLAVSRHEIDLVASIIFSEESA